MNTIVITPYLIAALVNEELIGSTLDRLWLTHPEHHHVLPICVFIVSDVSNAMERVSGVHTLLLIICDLDSIFGEGENTQVLSTGYPRHSSLSLKVHNYTRR